MSEHTDDELPADELDERASAWLDGEHDDGGQGAPGAELAARVGNFEGVTGALADVPPPPPGALAAATAAAMAAFDAAHAPAGEQPPADQADPDRGAIKPSTGADHEVPTLPRRSRRWTPARSAALAGVAAAALAVVGLAALDTGGDTSGNEAASVAATSAPAAAELRSAPAPAAASPLGAGLDTELGSYPTLDALARGVHGPAAAASSGESTDTFEPTTVGVPTEGAGRSTEGGQAVDGDAAAAVTTTSTPLPAAGDRATPSAIPPEGPAAPATTTTAAGLGPVSPVTVPPALDQGGAGASASGPAADGLGARCASLGGTPLGVAEIGGRRVRVLLRPDGSLAAYDLDCTALIAQTALIAETPPTTPG